MAGPAQENSETLITRLDELAQQASYSLIDSLQRDPDAKEDGKDFMPRQVFTGHYVPVKPTPINNPKYLAHSKQLFRELGLADSLALTTDFIKVFSGDLSQAPQPMRQLGWACGYALSIYGTEYTQQCPFQTGNGYGDGRALSVLEAVLKGQRWEMQLKGAGRTPYCRGGDGRAVLRSSVREFLAQEHMHALGVPTSRSLSLYVSSTEQAKRPWYSEGSDSLDPDQLILEPVAIATRVAPSFIRVGQLELFGRRARRQEHPQAQEELLQLVTHLIDREYREEIDQSLATTQQVLLLAKAFRGRLISLVANWIRVGYCQGNFNSDNCAAGGFTLDYGPFGFCEAFDPYYQPWTGGGRHFAFLNQPAAAASNFQMFCSALKPLLNQEPEKLQQLEQIQADFPSLMQIELKMMWASKLGLNCFHGPLFDELMSLMQLAPFDYTIFFRELSKQPEDARPLSKSLYTSLISDAEREATEAQLSTWFLHWKQLLASNHAAPSYEGISEQMQAVNPKYTLREWLLAPAYQKAGEGDSSLLNELHEVITQPYAELSKDSAEKYYRKRPANLFGIGGLSHYSCSS